MEFKDRQSTYPNRYKITLESGESYYATFERADEPIALGTLLNAETFNSLVSEINAKAPAITGAATAIATSDLTASRALVSNSSGKVAASGVTATELSYLDGVTGAIQTQLNGKQATIQGGASTIASSNLTASRALVSNSSGKVAASAVTATELGYLDGVTSNVQTQLNAKISGFTLLASGKTLNSSNPSFTISNVGGYKAFIFYGYTNTASGTTSTANDGYSSIVVPAAMITSTAQQFVIGHSIDSKIFSVKISSGTMTVANVGYMEQGIKEASFGVYGIV